jgi:hypothetical protein
VDYYCPLRAFNPDSKDKCREKSRHSTSVNKIWLGKRDLFQLFPDEIDEVDNLESDVQEICQLLEEDENGTN